MASTVFTENLITDPELLKAVQGEVFQRMRVQADPQHPAGPYLEQIALRAIQKDEGVFRFSLVEGGEFPPGEVQQALQRAVETVFDLPGAQVTLSASQEGRAGAALLASVNTPCEAALPAADPSEAAGSCWQSALAQLRRQIPHPVFGQYLQQAVFQSFERDSGVFTLCVADDYARDWLQSRLAKVIARILSGLLNQPTTIQFVAGPPQQTETSHGQATSPAGQAGVGVLAGSSEGTPEGGVELAGSAASSANMQLLDEARTSLREAFIDRNQIVNFPAYLLRWLPFAGPKAVALAIAFRQARYLAAGCSLNAKNAGEPFSVTAQEIYKWAGISRATFFRLLDSVELGWFIRKVPPLEKWRVNPETGGVKQAPNRYQFTAFAPLTPIDAEDLYQYLLKAGIRQDPAGVLARLVDEIQPRQVWRFPPPSPPGDTAASLIPQTATVYSVVMQAIREIPRLQDEPDPAARRGGTEIGASLAHIAALAEKLEERLTGGSVQLSWYFWTDLMPLLKETAGMLIVYLRSLGYYNRKTGEINDEVWIENGAEELARLLGLADVRNLVRWFPPATQRGRPAKSPARARPATRASQEYDQAKRELIARFVTRLAVKRGHGGRYDWKIKVAFSDPLSPADQVSYDELRQAIGEVAAACQSGSLEPGDVLALIEATRAYIQSSEADDLPLITNDKMRPSEAKQKDKVRLASNDKRRLWQWLTNDRLRLLNDKLRLANLDENDNLRLLPEGDYDKLRRFKILRVLNTLQELLNKLPTSYEPGTPQPARRERWVGRENMPDDWDLGTLIENNVFSADYQAILARSEGQDPRPFVSWLIHCISPSRGKGVENPVGVAIKHLSRKPGVGAGGACDRLARLSPGRLAQLIVADLNRDGPLDLPGYADWRAVMGGATQEQLVNLADCLGLALGKQSD